MTPTYGLGPVSDPSNFNIIITVLGIFIIVLGLISYVVKERLYISDSLVALLIGIALGPVGANFVRPAIYGDIDEITLAFTRLVIGIQLILAGIQLPSMYVWAQRNSIAMLLLPIMTAKWVISALILTLIFPLSYLESLVVAACITPTDPVLANAIVKGRYSEKYVSAHLRDIISAEAGANDGFGYPFLFLAIYLLKEKTHAKALADWVVHTCLYEIVLSVVYGIFVGLVLRLMLRHSLKKAWVDRETFPSFFLALALLVVGTCGMIGTDDLLAAFVAGNAFSLGDFYRDDTAEDSLQTSMDLLLNLSIFIWIGSTIPWDSMIEIDSGWRLLVATMSVLVFGRLPAMLTLYKFIPEIKSLKEAFFAGWFGPMGVGAIFYLEVAFPFFKDDSTYNVLSLHFKPIVYAMAIASITVHGITIPISLLGSKAGPALSNFTTTMREWTMDNDVVSRLPRYLGTLSNGGPPSS